MTQHRSAFLTIALALSALALTACDNQPKVSKPQNAETMNEIIEDGRQIAEAQCAACHAVGKTGESPNRKAPVFRTILARYSAGALAEELREGMRIGHAEMPQFQMEPNGVDELLAYLISIQEHEADATRGRPANRRS